MQDVDRPAHVQVLPPPARARGPRVEAESLPFVPRPEGLDRIGWHRARTRDVGPGPETLPQKRARPPRGRTGRADPGPPAPRHRRGPPPGTARPARRDRARDGGPFPRAGPARPPAAGPWLAWLQTHRPGGGPSPR